MVENMIKLYQLVQDTFGDALLMGYGEVQLHEHLKALIETVKNPYRKN